MQLDDGELALVDAGEEQFFSAPLHVFFISTNV